MGALLAGEGLAYVMNTSLEGLEPLVTAFVDRCSGAKQDLVRRVKETTEKRVAVFQTAVVEELSAMADALWVFSEGVDLAMVAIENVLASAGQEHLVDTVG